MNIVDDKRVRRQVLEWILMIKKNERRLSCDRSGYTVKNTPVLFAFNLKTLHRI